MKKSKRLARYEALQTISGTWIVMDWLTNLRACGPFDGKTGKAVARERRDKLELIAANERARKAGQR